MGKYELTLFDGPSPIMPRSMLPPIFLMIFQRTLNLTHSNQRIGRDQEVKRTIFCCILSWTQFNTVNMPQNYHLTSLMPFCLHLHKLNCSLSLCCAVTGLVGPLSGLFFVLIITHRWMLRIFVQIYLDWLLHISLI